MYSLRARTQVVVCESRRGRVEDSLFLLRSLLLSSVVVPEAHEHAHGADVVVLLRACCAVLCSAVAV